MYNLIEYSDVYSKTSSLWQYYRDEPATDNTNNITDLLTNNNSSFFKIKQQIIAETGNGGPKDVEIMVPLKYLNKKMKNNLRAYGNVRKIATGQGDDYTTG